jgi:hypothetical protein
MIATDHINFIGKRGLLSTDELRARGDRRRYASPYSERLRAALVASADRAGIAVRQRHAARQPRADVRDAAEVEWRAGSAAMRSA